MRMMLEDILTHYGHTVLQAKDGQESLNILQFGADAFVVKPFQAECLVERIG